MHHFVGRQLVRRLVQAQRSLLVALAHAALRDKHAFGAAFDNRGGKLERQRVQVLDGVGERVDEAPLLGRRGGDGLAHERQLVGALDGHVAAEARQRARHCRDAAVHLGQADGGRAHGHDEVAVDNGLGAAAIRRPVERGDDGLGVGPVRDAQKAAVHAVGVDGAVRVVKPCW